MIGNVVTVIVDRAMGTYHPLYPDMYYPINYGYVEGIIAKDGEAQDAYILGVLEPVKQFRGKVIAIIRRTNDIEDKWIVAPEGMNFSNDEIAEKVYFQEKYFDVTIERFG